MDAQETKMREVQRYLALTKKSVESMRHSSNASQLRNAWEDFLGNFARTIGRLISFAIEADSSRAWGHKLKNRSSKDDPGLLFLREARNAVEHGLEPFADFYEPNVSIGGGFFELEGNSSVEFSNCAINGLPMGNFNLKASYGKVVSVEGKPNVPIYEMPSNIKLKTINNAKKRVSVPVPTRIGDASIEKGNPTDLASKGTSELESLVEQLRMIWK